jgi:hypothetical protein
MTDERASPGWSTDRRRRDREYERVTNRAHDALQRLNDLAAEWDEFASDAARWAGDHRTQTTTDSLLLRLLLLPGRLHEVGAEDFAEQRGREYGDLELRSTNLLARKVAIESELAVVHDEFHAWARRHGAELVVDTAAADIDLASSTGTGALTAGTFPLPPKGHVLNSISCRDVGSNRWRTVRSYCRIRSALVSSETKEVHDA